MFKIYNLDLHRYHSLVDVVKLYLNLRSSPLLSSSSSTAIVASSSLDSPCGKKSSKDNNSISAWCNKCAQLLQSIRIFRRQTQHNLSELRPMSRKSSFIFWKHFMDITGLLLTITTRFHVGISWAWAAGGTIHLI